MEHGGRSTIRHDSLIQLLRQRHCDVNYLLTRLRLHVLEAQRVSLPWGQGRGRRRRRRRGRLLLLIGKLARGVVLLLAPRQLQQPQSLRWRIRQLPGVVLPSTTSTEPNISHATKKDGGVKDRSKQ